LIDGYLHVDRCYPVAQGVLALLEDPVKTFNRNTLVQNTTIPTLHFSREPDTLDRYEKQPPHLKLQKSTTC